MEEQLFEYLAKYIDLEEEEKVFFQELNLFRQYKKGDILLREGQYAVEGYFVIKGCLRSYYLSEGEEKTTAFYLEEEGLTPESMIDGKASEYYVRCEEDSILLVATADMEETAFSKFPRLESLCRVITEKALNKQQGDMGRFIKSSPEERYAYIQINRPQLLDRVPQYQIASYIGVKPETLSRIRKRMAEKEMGRLS